MNPYSGNSRLDTPLDEFAQALFDDGPNIYSLVAHGTDKQMYLNGVATIPEDYALYLANKMPRQTKLLVLYSCNVAEHPGAFAYKLQKELVHLGIKVKIRAPKTYLLMGAERADVLGVNGYVKYRNRIVKGSAWFKTVVVNKDGSYTERKNSWVVIPYE